MVLLLQVSAYVTAAHIKFLLLHDGRNEESIKGFFRDVYDAYLRVGLMCPGINQSSALQP
jgi:trafficking protein particle complex subunit 2